MIKVLALLIFGLSLIGLSEPALADTMDTDSALQTQQFKNETSPDFGVNNGQMGLPPMLPPHMNNINGQFEGRRPSKKPDSKPGGDKIPPEWDNSSNN